MGCTWKAETRHLDPLLPLEVQTRAWSRAEAMQGSRTQSGKSDESTFGLGKERVDLVK
jgi:hypothetical protein